MASKLSCCALVAILLSQGSGIAQAQNYAGDVTPAQCESIMSNAMNNPARSDTLSYTRHCAGFADSMVVLLRRLGRVAPDLAIYDGVAIVSGMYAEGPIYEAALLLARDTSEPDLARVAALSILLSYVTVGHIPFRPSFLADYTDSGDVCVGTNSIAGGEFPLPGTTPLPSGYRGAILGLARSIVEGSSSDKVKFLATCLVSQLTSWPPAIYQPENVSFSTSDFSFVKQCGRKFLLRNASNAAVSTYLIWARVDSYGAENEAAWTGKSRMYNLEPRPEGEPYSEVTWTVPGADSVAVVRTTRYVPLMHEAVNTTPC